MSDNYQTVFDAVRSRIGYIDIGGAVENAIGRPDIDSHFRVLTQELAYQYTRPSTMYRPKLMQDGNQWCALLGDDLQVGIAGFGDSPSDAMSNFDSAWHKKAQVPPQ